MSQLREEINVIPRAAWVTAVCGYIATVLLLLFVTSLRDPGAFTWPVSGRAVFSVGMPLILFVYVLLVGYVNGDARRRGMRHILWTLLAIFVPNAIGFILYFIMRDPLLRGCGACGTDVKEGFPFCPACGAAVGPTCPTCRHAVEPGWSHCARCGAQLHAGIPAMH